MLRNDFQTEFIHTEITVYIIMFSLGTSLLWYTLTQKSGNKAVLIFLIGNMDKWPELIFLDETKLEPPPYFGEERYPQINS